MMFAVREDREKIVNLVVPSSRLGHKGEHLFRRNCFDGCYK